MNSKYPYLQVGLSVWGCIGAAGGKYVCVPTKLNINKVGNYTEPLLACVPITSFIYFSGQGHTSSSDIIKYRLRHYTKKQLN